MDTPVYSFVIPVFNEQQVIPALFEQISRLLEKLDGDAEVLLIDDGSSDASHKQLIELHEKDQRFKVISFSRNFGHQAAVSAGLDFTTGQATIIMDADLQDPPEVVLELITKWREGYEIVYARRDIRRGEGFLKKLTAKVFYRLLDRMSDIDMPLDVGDFRLVDRKALNAFLALREGSRYVRGMFSWVGFKQAGITYERAERVAGDTKYPFAKMMSFALNAMLAFSNKPLRFGLGIGFLFAGVALSYGIVAIIIKISGAFTVPGWASLAALVAFIGGIQLVILGVIGEYIGKIYEEVKARPLYIVKSLHGLKTQKNPRPRSALPLDP